MAAKKSRGTAKRTSPGQTPIAKAASPVPHFSPEGPPADWERQHDVSLTRRLVQQRSNDDLRPVPRNASCHFYARDTARANIYFY